MIWELANTAPCQWPSSTTGSPTWKSWGGEPVLTTATLTCRT